MKPGDALNQTIAVFRLTVKDLAEDAGLHPEQISRYKNNKGDMTSKNLFEIINALPDEARKYFLSLTVKGAEALGNTDTHSPLASR